MIDLPLSVESQQRVTLAIKCRDCNDLPRVADAGKVFEAGGNSVQMMHNGIQTYCSSHYGPYNVEVIRQLKGVHEPQEERVFHEVLKQIAGGATIMELGSFWAYYSLWFLQTIRGSRAILIEPVPAALEAGKRNFALNGRQGTFINAAISDQCRPAAAIELWKGFEVMAETITVDSLMDSQSLEYLDVLHADIQGTEGRMLLGAERSLSQHRIGWLFLSTHSEYIHQFCRLQLFRHGYTIVAQHTPAESFSIDGLIVAAVSPQTPRIAISRRTSPQGVVSKLRAAFRIRVLEPLGLRERAI